MTILTDERLKALEPPEKGKRLLFDGHRNAPRGFGVRVMPSGKRTFVLRYNAGGRDRLLTIGEYGGNKWSLAAARVEAGKLRRQIDGGADILQERRTERAEPSVSDAVERFVKSKAGLQSAGAIEAALNRHLLPALGDRKVRQVRRRDVIAVIEAIAVEHPRQAGKVLTYTKQLFSWAEDRELVEVSPIASLKPKRIAGGLIARKRARVLDDDEIRGFWQNVEDCGIHGITAQALKFVLVTGQRPGEIAGMRWDEINDGVWTVPASRRGKTNDTNTIPLTRTARAILEAARTELERLGARRKGKAGGHVFEARPGRPITVPAMSRAIARYTQQLGNKPTDPWGNWTPHDLRRTMRTGLSACGIAENISERVIGHVKRGILSVYDHHTFDAEKVAALEAWERRRLRIVEGKPATDNIVNLR